MRLTPWLSLFTKLLGGKSKARRPRSSAVARPENLEDRALLTPLVSSSYVDDDWSAYTNGQVIADADLGTAGDQPATYGVDAFSTIQAAVNATNAAGTTVVNDGTYNENVTISKALTLVSAHGRDSTTIAGVQAGSQLGAVVIASGANNVQVGSAGHGFKILGIDGTAAIEKAAVYVQGNHTNIKILDNELNARGDSAFTAEYGSTITGMTIDGNTFSGTTFIGTPSGSGNFIDIQFSLNNVPRQLIVMGNGGGAGASLSSDVHFTNNLITGTSGGISNTDSVGNPAAPHEYGNQLVTIDVTNADIAGNVFEGTTTGVGTAALRVRRVSTGIVNNTFDSADMGTQTVPIYVENNDLDTVRAANLVLTPSPTPDTVVIDRSTGGGDLVFQVVGGIPQVSTDGGVTFTDLDPTTTTVQINGSASEDDTFILDLSNGATFPNIVFNGGVGGNDKLVIKGDDNQNVVYTPDTSTFGNGVVDFGGTNVTFTGLEPVDFDNVGTFTLNLAGDDDVVTVTAGMDSTNTVPALVFTGTSGGIAFESAHVYNTTNVIVDTTADDGNDTINIVSVNNALDGNTNLSFITGTGTDSLNVTGAVVVNGDFSADVPTVYLSNNITAATITGTASTVVIQSSLASIQDAIDIGADGVVVNILGGTYGGAVTTAGKAVTLAPIGIGTVNLTGNLTLDDDDVLQLTMVADGVNSSFNVTGSVTLGNAAVDPALGYVPEYGDVFTIINNDGADAVTGLIAGVPEGGILVDGLNRYIVSYVGGDGNDVTLTVARPAVSVSLSNGNLVVTGTTEDDFFTIQITGTNQVRLIGTDGTNFSGAGGNNVAVGPFNVTGTVTVNTGNGDDEVSLVGVGGSARLNGGKVSVDLGAGDDVFAQTGAALQITSSLSILGGAGNDSVTLGAPATGLIVGGLTIDNGTDNGGVVPQAIDLTGVTVNGNTTLTNSGTAAQTVNLGTIGVANTFNGNLTIKQTSTVLPTANVTYTANVTNSVVTGNLAITNGNTTAAGSIGVNLVDVTVGGVATVINGNSGAGGTSVVTDGTDVAGNLTVQNGNSVGANVITITDAVVGGKGNSFTNGTAGTTNAINLGLGGASTFAGAVAATNTSATTSNSITIAQGSITGPVTLANKLAVNGAASNTVTIGSQGAVSINGNTSIANPATTGANAVDIDQLTTSGAKLGDVNIANNTAATTLVTIGDTVANTLGGDLKITNQATTGTRTTTIDRTTVNGKTGVYLSNLGAGNTATTVGDVVGVNVANALRIDDGTGEATVDIQNVNVGSLNFADLGGGANLINVGGENGGVATIVGVARITTGSANDTVNIGTVGSALLNGSIAVTLGAGDDELVVGDNAASPALDPPYNLSFDGGSGIDTFVGSTVSLDDYETGVNAPGKKLKNKITAFETYDEFGQP